MVSGKVIDKCVQELRALFKIGVGGHQRAQAKRGATAHDHSLQPLSALSVLYTLKPTPHPQVTRARAHGLAQRACAISEATMAVSAARLIELICGLNQLF